jgi:hypothetical protein
VELVRLEVLVTYCPAATSWYGISVEWSRFSAMAFYLCFFPKREGRATQTKKKKKKQRRDKLAAKENKLRRRRRVEGKRFPAQSRHELIVVRTFCVTCQMDECQASIKIVSGN